MVYLAPIDAIALVVFFACWIGYTQYADRWSGDRKSLMSVMHGYRVLWMERLLRRDIRMVDSNIVAAQMRSVTLFTSVSIFILGALIAIMGSLDQARAVISAIPFAVDAPKFMWEVKILLLMVIFVYSFFKFAWALRQFNYGIVLVGAAPMAAECDAGSSRKFAHKTAQVLTLATGSFNRGIRAYYFGLAILSWFIQPGLLIAASVWVVLVLYRREFRSQTLAALGED